MRYNKLAQVNASEIKIFSWIRNLCRLMQNYLLPL